MKQCEKCDYLGVDAPCARCGSTMMRRVSGENGTPVCASCANWRGQHLDEYANCDLNISKTARLHSCCSWRPNAESEGSK